MAIIDNPVLYEQAKAIADSKYAKPSAYKSGYIVRLYKSLGGTYSGKKSKALTKQIAEIQGGAISKAIQTRARKMVRATGEDYSEEDVQRKAEELHQKYLANKEKASSRAEKREERARAREHMITIPVLPESPDVILPRYYAVEKTKNVKYKKKNGEEVSKVEKSYKLVNPLTKQRNIAERKGVKPITLKRKDVDGVEVEDTVVKTIPLSKFVPADQKKAFIYNRKREKWDNRGTPAKDRPDKTAFTTKERGRPELLPKNVYHHQDKGTSKLMEKLGKLRNPRQPEETKEEERQGEEKDGYEPFQGYEPDYGEPPRSPPKSPPKSPKPPEPYRHPTDPRPQAKKKAGRPKKYQTAEEAKKAKFAMTVESNRRRRGEKRDEKTEGAERDAMGAEDRPPKAKKIDKEGLVSYYQKIRELYDKNRDVGMAVSIKGRIRRLFSVVSYILIQLGYKANREGDIEDIPRIKLTGKDKDDLDLRPDSSDYDPRSKGRGTIEMWFNGQKEVLRKMGVTEFAVRWTLNTNGVQFIRESGLEGSGITSPDKVIPKFAKGSQEARDHMARIRAMRGKKGEGIIDNLRSGFNSAVGAVVDTGKQVVGAVTDKAKQFGNTFSQIITGSTDYSPSVRKILNEQGSNQITSIVVGRTPVQQAITMALNAVSQGQFQSNQDRLNYDKLFHLFSEITLENGKQVRVEKNEVITMTMGFKQDADTERQEVPMTKAVSFRELLDNAKNKMGGKFFAYDSANNNCQDFIMALLQGSGLGTQENYEFIKQNTKQLFEKIPRTRALAKQITNLGQRINIAMAGGKISGNSMPKFAKGSQEARDHMARIRAMRGSGTGKDLGKNLGSNLGRLADSGTDKLIDMMGKGTGTKLGSNLAGNLGRLADSGTDKLIDMMGTGATEYMLAERIGKKMTGTGATEKMMGTHIHHHHYYGNLPMEGRGTGYGQGVGDSSAYGSHSGGTVGYSNSGQFGGRGFAEDLIGKLGIKMPTNAKEAVQQAQILQGLTPQGMLIGQVKKMMGRGGPKGLASFKKWTTAIGDFLKPVAKPILEAGTQQAVKNINAYGDAYANRAY